MEKGEIQAALGALLAVIFFILTRVFYDSHASGLPSLLFFGSIVCGGLFAYSINTTQVKWARITSKVFFLLPLSFIIYWLVIIIWGGSSLQLSQVFIILGILLSFILTSVLIFWIDETKDISSKILTWIVGLFLYFVIGFIESFSIEPHSS